MKDCPPDKIRNPATGRCVSRTGAIGKKLAATPKPTTPKRATAKDCPPDKIRNPATGRCVSRTGAIGRKLAATPKPTTPKRPAVKDCPPYMIRNPKTGRCVSRTGPIGRKLVEAPKPVVAPKKKSDKKKVPRTFVSGSPPAYTIALNYIREKHKECFIIPRKKFVSFDEYVENFLVWEDYSTPDTIIEGSKSGYSLYGNRATNVIKKTKKKPDFGALFVHKDIKKRIMDCMKGPTRFIVIPIFIRFIRIKNAHANMLIYDKQSRTAERYEPNGNYLNSTPKQQLIQTSLNESLRDFLLDFGIISNSKGYYGPLDMCPTWGVWQSKSYGHQLLQGMERKGFMGSCATWTTWYTDYRLSHPNLSRDEAFKQSFDHLKRSSPSFTQFIKEYFADIYEYSQK